MDLVDIEQETKRELKPKLRFPDFRDTEGWEETTIGDIGSFYYGKSAPKWSLKEDAPTRCVRYGELYTKFGAIISETYSRTNIDPKNLRFSKGGEILVPRVGEKPDDFGKCCCYLPLANIAIGEMISVFETAQNPLFYTYYFRKLYRQFAKVVEGQNVKNLYYVELEPLPIHRPSLLEQQKIADCLSSIDDRITAETQKLDTLRAHKKGLMQQLFPAEGETLPKLRFPKFRDAEEWEEMQLDDIATIRAGTTPSRSNPEFYVDGIIPWVKTTDLNNSYIYTTEEKVTPLAKVKLNPEGSVLVAMYGGFNQIGRTGYLKITAATNQAISVLNIRESKLTSLYLLIWLNAKINYWKKFAISSRKDANITGSDVAAFPITFPSLPEQQKIADCLSSLDELIAAQTQKIDTLRIHKKGLMQQLFPSVNGEE